MLATLAVAAFVLSPVHAATRTWDNDNADGLWSTAANWSDDTLPVANDTADITNGDTVNWNSAVSGQNLPANLTINLTGGSSITESSVIRLNNATISVGSGSGLTSIGTGFWDLANADITFDDGAIATMDAWENKGTNTFTFNLGASGFTTLTPNRFFIGGGATIANATYTVDMAAYTGGSGVITLVDYTSDFASMDNATFQGAGGLNVINTGSNTARLYWDDAAEAIKLTVNPTTTWDAGGGDGEWKTATNWAGTPDDQAPVANDIVNIANGDTVNFDGSSGSQNLAGNLTINVTGNSTFAATGVIRLNNANITVGSGSTLTSNSGAFWDLDDADITFEDGAIVTIDDWENKDVNTFTFVLGAAGFDTLTPNRFLIGNGSLTGDIANATYNVDMAAYTGGVGVITLVNYNIDSEGMTDAIFQGAGGLNVLNAGNYTADIRWNDATEAIELHITSVPTPTALAAGLVALLAGVTRRRR